MVCRMKADLASIRSDYQRAGLDEQSAPSDPIRLFERWMQDAIDAKHPEPNAATLATLGEDGDPDARVVLLKGVDDAGFVFYTSYESAKARQLAAHPRATLVFFWLMLERQVRVRGEVTRVPEAESDAYFASRPRESQLGAWTSHQSAVIGGRAELEAKLAEVTARYDGKDVPRPPTWGGFRIAPTSIELWQGRPARLHDRLRYARGEAGAWSITRLSP